MLVHTIRLRDPWTSSAAEGGGEWLTRRFAAPTGIGREERVLLAVGDFAAAALVLLNGQELGRLDSGGSGRWDITDRLTPRNEISIGLDSAHRLARGCGRELLVRLEIETGASDG